MRNIGTPGFNGTQQSHHHLDRALGADRDQFFRTDSQLAQSVRQLVGPSIQFPVSKLFRLESQRQGVRRALHLIFNELLQRTLTRIRMRGVIPLHHNLPPLGLGQ